MTGTIDMVYLPLDPSERECIIDDEIALVVIFADWKRPKKIHKYSFNKERGSGPCANLYNTNYEHYSLQQNIYKYLIENFMSGIKYNGKVYNKIYVRDMFLVCMHPGQKNGKYILEPIYSAQYQPIVKHIFDIRKQELQV